jgi:hypothetical protein
MPLKTKDVLPERIAEVGPAAKLGKLLRFATERVDKESEVHASRGSPKA